MKFLLRCLPFTSLVSLAFAQSASSSVPPLAPSEKLGSAVYAWDEMKSTPTKLGSRRDVLDGRTATVDKLHCHITTLNPGEQSSEPSLHLQEEIIIVKEGTVEAHFDGQSKIAGPGSVIHFAAHATTNLKNVGPTPATYTVIYFYTPLTPKS